jgi:hypothetical protein
MVFENTHERIVPQEIWDLVQQLRKTKRRVSGQSTNRYPIVTGEDIDTAIGQANPLTGLLWCAQCGSKMHYHKLRNGHLDRYTCSKYSNRARTFKADKCSSHHISTKAVRSIILEVIKKTTNFAREHEDEFVKILKENSSVKQTQTIKNHSKQIAKNERRVGELDKLFGSVYEDKVKGIISEERFIQMSILYEQEQLELKEKNEILQKEIDDFKKGNEDINCFILNFRTQKCVKQTQ